MLPTSNNTEDLAIYEDKDGDWGGGASTTAAPTNPQEVEVGEGQELPGAEVGTRGNPGTGLPQEQLEPRDLPVEESRTQPDKPSSGQEEKVVYEPVEPARNGERLNRDLSEEPQVRDSQITHQEPAPQQEKEPREQERRVTKIKGKVPSKFSP